MRAILTLTLMVCIWMAAWIAGGQFGGVMQPMVGGRVPSSPAQAEITNAETVIWLKMENFGYGADFPNWTNAIDGSLLSAGGGEGVNDAGVRTNYLGTNNVWTGLVQQNLSSYILGVSNISLFMIVSNSPSTVGTWLFQVRNADNSGYRVKFATYNSAPYNQAVLGVRAPSDAVAALVVQDAASIIQPGRWQLVEATLNLTTKVLKWYTNGVLVNITTNLATGDSLTNQAPRNLHFGYDPNYGSSKSWMAEVIVDRAAVSDQLRTNREAYFRAKYPTLGWPQ